MLVKKNVVAFFGLPPVESEGKLSLVSLIDKIENLMSVFCEKSMFLNLTHCFILNFLSAIW